MKMRLVMTSGLGFVVFPILLFFSHSGLAADKLIGFHSARTMSQSMPWIAEEAGLFRKYDLDFQLVYIRSWAAMAKSPSAEVKRSYALSLKGRPIWYSSRAPKTP
ncbi:MAG: hypothetical protein AUH87_05060 [Deltaproteobacteria bacterium 13_1_40CM_4_54_4]|nr:MAG: hypothetical protein AUH87_05060 [Deltaproteobacteria bacterium 13_1_40CM_4_54_4]